MADALIAEIDRLVRAELPRLVEIRRDLHAHPQRGFQETYAAEVVQRELKAAGVPFQAGVGRTGVVGWLASPPSAGREAVALRADMDALPLTEQTGRPYASQNPGCMHACGHDGHVAILIGAARVLARLRDRLSRPVKFIFQPAEEGLGGARSVIEDGALEERVGGVRVASIFGLHGWPALELGTIGTRAGPLMARADSFRITVRGRGGHGAMPQKAADPVVAAAHVVTAVQSIVARNVDPTDSAVITVGRLQAGTAINIIPESAELAGTIRSLTDEVADLLARRLQEVAAQVSAGMGCSAETTVRAEYPATVNDDGAVQTALRAGRAVLGEPGVRLMDRPEMVSEDFSYYGRRVPGCYILLGLRPAGQSAYPPVHSPQFDFNDEAIGPGARMLAALGAGVGA